MITYIAEILNFVAVTFQCVLLGASFIGKVIVSVVAGVSSVIWNVIENVILFFQIVYEDNVFILTEQLPSVANNIIDTFANQWSYLQNGLSMVYYDLNNKFYAIIGSIKWSVDAVIIVVCEVLLLFKNATIFIGNTIWFILTFIPVHLPQIIKAILRNVTDSITNSIVDVYMALLKITNFLTDVPLESFVGITSAIVIVRLCIHFRETIQSKLTTYYWSLLRQLWYYYYALYNYFIDQEVREITRMSSGQELTVREATQSAAAVDDSNTEALCVICQERQKCVLTLPCRHVCLCTECCMRLYGYQRTCPICRTFIYHSVTVYL